MTVDAILKDEEFGQLLIRCNARAKRYTFRPGPVALSLLITVPTFWSEQEVRRSVDKLRPELRRMLRRAQDRQTSATTLQKQKHIDWDFRIGNDLISLCLQPDAQLHDRCCIHREQGHIVILCPADFDFDAEGRQEWLVKVIEQQIRNYAKGLLPAQLRTYILQTGIRNVTEIHVTSAKGRWGSCSSQRSSKGYHINLSLYTLLLPLRLRRLVMMHELAHTFEMNHSDRFHQKLGEMLAGDPHFPETEAQLEKDLKKYTTSVFAFMEAESDADVQKIT